MKKLLFGLVLLCACYRDADVTRVKPCRMHTDCNVPFGELCQHYRGEKYGQCVWSFPGDR